MSCRFKLVLGSSLAFLSIQPFVLRGERAVVQAPAPDRPRQARPLAPLRRTAPEPRLLAQARAAQPSASVLKRISSAGPPAGPDGPEFLHPG